MQTQNVTKGSNKNAKAAPAAPAAAPAPAAPAYVVGKVYNPRQTTLQGNAASWAATQAFLASNGGQATLAQLQQHLAAQRNHANFVKYALRRGWLVQAPGK